MTVTLANVMVPWYGIPAKNAALNADHQKGDPRISITLSTAKLYPIINQLAHAFILWPILLMC